MHLYIDVPKQSSRKGFKQDGMVKGYAVLMLDDKQLRLHTDDCSLPFVYGTEQEAIDAGNAESEKYSLGDHKFVAAIWMADYRTPAEFDRFYYNDKK